MQEYTHLHQLTHTHMAPVLYIYCIVYTHTYTHTPVLWGGLGCEASWLRCVCQSLSSSVSITAVATVLQGATTIYWTVVVLQESRGGKKTIRMYR